MSADVDKDHVTRTNPAAGSPLKKGEQVTLYIASGMTQVPNDLVGKPKQQVLDALNKLGFSTNLLPPEYSDSVADGSVTQLDPAPGTAVQKGSTITIHVSKGKEQITLPTDITLGTTTYAQARDELTGAGFSVALSDGSDPKKANDSDIVTAINVGGKQNQPGGTYDKGSTVTLTLQPASSPDTDGTGDTGGGQ
jgi:serine/threonine-protein kinase